MILKMNKTLKISAIVAIFLFLIVYLIGKYNPFSMEFIITQHGIISEFIANNFILSSIICTLLIVVTVSLMGAITPVIILAGFYFGLTTALFISIAGEVLGAIIVFFYGRFLFKSYFLNKLGTRFKSFQEKFNNIRITKLLIDYIETIDQKKKEFKKHSSMILTNMIYDQSKRINFSTNSSKEIYKIINNYNY